MYRFFRIDLDEALLRKDILRQSGRLVPGGLPLSISLNEA